MQESKECHEAMEEKNKLRVHASQVAGIVNCQQFSNFLVSEFCYILKYYVDSKTPLFILYLY